jgi:hypothetical protein
MNDVSRSEKMIWLQMIVVNVFWHIHMIASSTGGMCLVEVETCGCSARGAINARFTHGWFSEWSGKHVEVDEDEDFQKRFEA